jgi:prephenate dehydrogenase
MAIAKGLMSEDDYLLSEILFNPNTPDQLQRIQEKLAELRQIVIDHDADAMKRYLDAVRDNLK